MNILFPTDFSDNAELASQVAIDLTKKTVGKLLVFNSYDLPYSDRSMTISLMEVMRENAEKNMEAYAKSIQEKGVDFETKVLMGNPIRLIKELSRENEIDLVVMGTKGASGVEEVLIGSNAASTIQNTETPVLVIPPKYEPKDFRTIVMACDFDLKGKAQPIKQLSHLADLYGAEIEILYVQNGKDISEGERDFISKNMGDTPHHFSILRGDDVEETILKESERKSADLISTITKRYGFFEGLFHRSVTNKLAYHSEIPLLALHEPKE